MTTRIEINHLDAETRREVGFPSVVVMRVRCDEPGCQALSGGVYAENEKDRFSEMRAKGEAARAGWKVGEHSDGKSDRCPEHAPVIGPRSVEPGVQCAGCGHPAGAHDYPGTACAVEPHDGCPAFVAPTVAA